MSRRCCQQGVAVDHAAPGLDAGLTQLRHHWANTMSKLIRGADPRGHSERRIDVAMVRLPAAEPHATRLGRGQRGLGAGRDYLALLLGDAFRYAHGAGAMLGSVRGLRCNYCFTNRL